MHSIIRRGAHSTIVAAIAGFALCAAHTVHADDGQTSPGATVTAASEPSGSADVSWVLPTQNADKTALTDLAGILIYYGTSASNLSRCVVANGASATNYTISGLTTGTWYFVTQAFTADGGVSPLTGVVSKTIR